MNPGDFVKKYIGFARECETKTRISSEFILAQAALESGWGEAAPGNMFFGVKDTDGLNGNEQLLRTTEYSRRSDLKFPVILSVDPVIRNGRKYFRYRIKDWFRKYETPGESFDDHARFFHENPRYRSALAISMDPVQMAVEVAKAGYATDPDYSKKLISIIRTIQSEIEKTDKP